MIRVVKLNSIRICRSTKLEYNIILLTIMYKYARSDHETVDVRWHLKCNLNFVIGTISILILPSVVLVF